MAVGEPMLSRKHPRPQQRGSRSSHTELRIPPRRRHSRHRHRLVAIHDSAFVPNPLPATSAFPSYLYPRPPHAVVYLAQLPLPSSVVGSCPPFSAAFAPTHRPPLPLPLIDWTSTHCHPRHLATSAIIRLSRLSLPPPAAPSRLHPR
ncbi:Os05g0351400 [Oryza sativa Japonica Group]|uniref:Os05g0351400 protein n=2 Tax=Oryza sativa subsp. japonica TaxID=39947 RepID=A0A0P0WL73_ORYSJ|nr:hypothetical protein [Oryza sativa Japonica Group]EEE63368.1 hypothetical protein OsJ_18180 [Oryza sativa Japonica Group]BAS93539.1 Os05g0351400 [Oryza sativa Japonica Group]